MTSKDRVKELRKSLNLSQEAFGNKLGVRKSTISRIESGVHNLSERMAISICNTFNVDINWLMKGHGNMFTAIPESIVDVLCDEFNLDTKDRAIIEAYLRASENERENIKDFLLSIAENLQKKSRWINICFLNSIS